RLRFTGRRVLRVAGLANGRRQAAFEKRICGRRRRLRRPCKEFERERRDRGLPGRLRAASGAVEPHFFSPPAERAPISQTRPARLCCAHQRSREREGKELSPSPRMLAERDPTRSQSRPPFS